MRFKQITLSPLKHGSFYPSGDTLRIHASIHQSSNVDFVCYITEFGTASLVDTHTSTYINAKAETSTTVSNPIGQTVDLGETMEWFQGHTHDANESSIGSEELTQVRLTSSTNWEWDITTDPGSGPTTAYLGVFDWNNLDVTVQRDQAQIGTSSTSTTVVGGVDFTAVDRTRSLLFASFTKSDTGATYTPNTSYIRATITESGNLVFTRNTSDSNTIDINWTLVELPEDYANIRHGNHTQTSGTSTNEFDLASDIVDTSRAFVIGTVCTPFGCGTGSSSSTVAGAIDRTQATLELIDLNTVRVQRGDGTDNFEIGYQVIEFLPKKRVVTESLSISDSLTTTAAFTTTLDETLALSDTLSAVNAATVTLDETLRLR